MIALPSDDDPGSRLSRFSTPKPILMKIAHAGTSEINPEGSSSTNHESNHDTTTVSTGVTKEPEGKPSVHARVRDRCRNTEHCQHKEKHWAHETSECAVKVSNSEDGLERNNE